MTTKKFIIKTVSKLLILVILSTIVMALVQSPTISNDIAMGQMENDDGAFLMMEIYNKIRPVIDAIYACIVILIVGTIGYNAYKLFQKKKRYKRRKK